MPLLSRRPALAARARRRGDRKKASTSGVGPSRHFSATQQLVAFGAKRTLSGSRCAPNL